MNPGKDKAISLTELQNDAEAGKISEVTINGTEATGKFKDGKATFHTTVPANYPDLYKDLISHGVDVSQKDQNGTLWLNILFQIVPVHDAADAEWRKQGAELWQESRAPALDAAEEDYVQGRCGR
jgi:ATP-dependent Zn protease